MNQPARHLRRPPEAPATPGRHLTVLDRSEPSRARRRRRARAMVAAAVGGVVAVMFALVYLHVVLAQRQMELDGLSTSLAADTTHYQDLRLRVAELESPQQIISVAEGRLGMRPPATVTYVSPPAGSPPGQPSTSASTSESRSTARPTPAVTAPGGDADWPTVKAVLAGRP